MRRFADRDAGHVSTKGVDTAGPALSPKQETTYLDSTRRTPIFPCPSKGPSGYLVPEGKWPPANDGSRGSHGRGKVHPIRCLPGTSVAY